MLFESILFRFDLVLFKYYFLLELFYFCHTPNFDQLEIFIRILKSLFVF